MKSITMSTQQLTQEEIARVFFMHYGCEYRFEDLSHIYKIGECNTFKLAWEQDFNNCKLLLTPLYRISDEDAIEVAKIMEDGVPYKSYSVERTAKDNTAVWFAHWCVRIYHDGRIKGSQALQYIDSRPFQYLISKGYAVPLFFAPNHWANGKTAIELGIAIDNLQTK